MSATDGSKGKPRSGEGREGYRGINLSVWGVIGFCLAALLCLSGIGRFGHYVIAAKLFCRLPTAEVEYVHSGL